MNCLDNKLIFERYTLISENIVPANLQVGDQFSDTGGSSWEVVNNLGSPPTPGATLSPNDEVSKASTAGPVPVDQNKDLLLKPAGTNDMPQYYRVVKDDGSVVDWIDPNSYRGAGDVKAADKESAAQAQADKKAAAKQDNTAWWGKAGQAATDKMAQGAGGSDWVTRGALGLAGKGIKAIAQKAPERGAGAVGYV